MLIHSSRCVPRCYQPRVCLCGPFHVLHPHQRDETPSRRQKGSLDSTNFCYNLLLCLCLCHVCLLGKRRFITRLLFPSPEMGQSNIRHRTPELLDCWIAILTHSCEVVLHQAVQKQSTASARTYGRWVGHMDFINLPHEWGGFRACCRSADIQLYR